MKKTLIALATLAAAGATLAQSSVTVYGRLDLGMSSVDHSLSAPGFNASVDVDSLAGAQNGRTTSRLGFRGTEDLGGGLRAGFNYETALGIDAGAAAFGNTRLANLSLSGAFGTVVIGTFNNQFDAIRGMSAASFAGPGGDFLARHASASLGFPGFDGEDPVTFGTIGFGGRTENAIAYVSPSFNGFTVGLGLVNESTKATATGSAAAGEADFSGYILSASYDQGPLRVLFAHGDGNGTNQTLGAAVNGADTDLQTTSFGVSYNFGFMVPYIQYQTSEASTRQRAVATFNSVESDAFEIGATFPMGAFTPFVAFGNGDVTERATGDIPFSVDTRSFQVGTTYTLSRRTSVYANIGEFRVKGPATDPFTLKTKGYRIGLVHTF